MNIIENVPVVTHALLYRADTGGVVVTIEAGDTLASSLTLILASETQAEVLQASSSYDFSQLEELPEAGRMVYKKPYSYNGRLVFGRQEHTRTEFAPEETPALLYFFRDNPEGMEWIEQEMVSVGNTRTWEGITYTCLQAHVTLEGWEPPNVPALWQEAGGGISDWSQPTGGHDAYNTGDEVMFNGTHYRSLIDANVWSPAVYPAGWEEVV